MDSKFKSEIQEVMLNHRQFPKTLLGLGSGSGRSGIGDAIRRQEIMDTMDNGESIGIVSMELDTYHYYDLEARGIMDDWSGNNEFMITAGNHLLMAESYLSDVGGSKGDRVYVAPKPFYQKGRY